MKEEDFKAARKCLRRTKNGGVCKRRVVHGHVCWYHGVQQDHLRIKKSTIRGADRGLFDADAEVGKNVLITKFKGPRIPKSTVDSYSAKHQALCVPLNKGIYVDSSKTNSCFARYANEATKQKDQNAVIGRVDGENKYALDKAALISTKPIHPGDEIKTDYGFRYPRNYPHWRRGNASYEKGYDWRKDKKKT